MSTKLRIYIASPISRGDLAENIRRGTEAAVRLMRGGFAVMAPVLSCYMGGPEPRALPAGFTHDDWLDMDFSWISVSDAVLRLPGESVGADREVALALDLGIPVYYDVEELIANQPCRGDERFHELLRAMGRLHAKKAHDYGRGSDPLANLRGSAEVGVEPWRATWLRAQDKVHRIKSYCPNGSLANEGVEDSLMDLSAYCLLTLILHREGQRDLRALEAVAAALASDDLVC